MSAFDFIEHTPRVIYAPDHRFCFIELMNEIYRALKIGGIFYAHTPAYPAPEAFQDPTHVNIITEETFKLYFCGHRVGAIYGFKGNFNLEDQHWSESKTHLITQMSKI